MYDKDAAREARVNFWPRVVFLVRYRSCRLSHRCFQYQKRLRLDDHTFFSSNPGPEYRSFGTVCEVVVKPMNLGLYGLGTAGQYFALEAESGLRPYQTRTSG
jgi:hypothetical protein